MELNKELIKRIKKYELKGHAAAESNLEKIMVSMNAGFMSGVWILRLIGTELEKISDKIRELEMTTRGK
jgi:hypothetical protein